MSAVRGASHAPGLRLLALASLVSLVSLVSPPPGSAAPREPDFPRLAPQSRSPVVDRPRIRVGFGMTHAFDDDVDATYGALPSGRLGFSIPVMAGLDAAGGVGWWRKDGDPYYDAAIAFDGGHQAALTVVSIELGLIAHDRSWERGRMNVGVFFEEIYARERIPHAWFGDPADRDTFSGWGWGVRWVVGPEWFLADRRYSLGFTLGVAARSLDVRGAARRRNIRLDGPEWGIHASCCL